MLRDNNKILFRKKENKIDCNSSKFYLRKVKHTIKCMFNFFSDLKKKYAEIASKVVPYQIVLMGNYLMYIEGNLSVMSIKNDNIVLRVKGGVIVVTGTNLAVKDISEFSITIIGNIKGWENV